MKYKIVTTNHGDNKEDTKEELLEHLRDGWEILSSAHTDYGHVDYILRKTI